MVTSIMFCMLQATSRHKTDKHEAMRKEEEKVRKKVNKQLLNVILLTNKLQYDQRVGTHLISSGGSRLGEV